MLTQDDLQAIGKIINEKIGPLETRMSSFDKKLVLLDKKTNRGFKSVDRKLDVIINYFDHQDIDIRNRLNRIELHLGLATLNS